MTRHILTGAFVLVFFQVIAQPDVDRLTERFNAYQSIWKKNRICLIFNQEKFSPGDTVWFKAYLLADDLSVTAGKQKIEIHLLDAQGTSMVHSIFNIYDGVGYNQIVIPEGLAPGLYLVTAHTAWMKNFRPLPFFKRELSIVADNAVVADERPSIIAVPEGGHLVRDIPNRVAFRARPPGATVRLVDSTTGALVDAVDTDANGTASITFTPASDHRYLAQTAGASVSLPLPAAEDGCSLQMHSSPDEGTVTVRAASPPGSPLRQSHILLVISGNSRIYKTEKFQQGDREWAEVPIETESLPPGIAHASLFGPDGEVLASRDFYVPAKPSVVVRATMKKNSFSTRERIGLDVSIVDQSGRPLPGEFSISVVNGSLLAGQIENSLADELALFPRQGFFIDRSDANWFTGLDNYLICETQDIPWKAILSGDPGKPGIAFTQAIEKRGVAFFGDLSEPVPDFTQVMFYLQHDKLHYQTFTLHGGHVRLTLPDIFKPDEFFYVAATRKGKEIEDLKIRWDNDSLRLPAARPARVSETPDPYAAFVKKARLINRSYGYFRGKARGDNGQATADVSFEHVVGGADITVRVPDYVAMSTMSELIREVIPSLYARGTGAEARVRVNLPEPLYPATGDPVYIIDGIATQNTAFFLSLDPGDLLSVKIVTDPRKLAPFKLMGRNGIVIVDTKAGNVREPLDDNAKLLDGLSSPAAFRPPDFSHDAGGRVPDFRSTVYWNPSIATDADGKASVQFRCSDDIGRLRIRIDGLADGGHPFSSVLYVEVVAH